MSQYRVNQNLRQLGLLLEKIILAQNTQRVREVETALALIEKFPNCFELLLDIIQIKEFSQNIRKLATAIIKNVAHEHLFPQTHQLSQYSNRLLACLQDPANDFCLKANIAIVLAEVLKREGKKQNFQNMFNTLRSYFTPFPGDYLKLDVYILLGRTMIEANAFLSHDLLALVNGYIEVTLTLKDFLRVKLENGEIGLASGIAERLHELLSLIISLFKDGNRQLLQDQTRFMAILRIVPVDFQNRILVDREIVQQGGLHEKLSELQSKGYDLLSKIMEKCDFAGLAHIPEFKQKVNSAAQKILNDLTNLYISNNQYPREKVVEKLTQSQLNFLCHLYNSSSIPEILMNYDRILLKVISLILEYSPNEIQNFLAEPGQFTNTINIVLQARFGRKAVAPSPLYEFSSLKVHATQLLILISKARPALCREVMSELIAIVSQFIRFGSECINLLFFLNILSEDANCRQAEPIRSVLQFSFSRPPPRHFINNEKQCIQYAFYLVTLSTFIRQLCKLSADLPRSTLVLSIQLISNAQTFQVYKILACEILQSLIIQQQSNWIIKQALQMLNDQLRQKIISRSVNVYLLDALFTTVYSFSSFRLEHCPYLEDTLKCVGICIEKELSNRNFQQLIVNKCWNIIRAIGERDIALNHLLTVIQQTITPLSDYIVLNLNGDFQEDCFILMSSFIKHSKRVSNFVLEMYHIIPLVFYKQYHGRFGHSFETLQLFIFYGKDILLAKRNILQEIIEMCLFSMKLPEDVDSCEGIFLLQSLILSLGNSLNESHLRAIIQQIERKYSKPNLGKQLRPALANLQGLCLALVDKEWMTPSYLSNTFKRLLIQCPNTKDPYFYKLSLISSCEILLKLTEKHVNYFLYDFITLLRHCERLFFKEVKEEPQIKSEYNLLKEIIVNFAVNMDVRTYFSDFLHKFEKLQYEVFKIFMEESQWNLKRFQFQFEAHK